MNKNEELKIKEEILEEKSEDVKLSRKEKKKLSKVEKLKLEAKMWEDKYYRALADMDNTRKQNEKDRADFLKYRTMGFIDNLLLVLDGFNHAISIEQDDPTVKNYLIGFTYIYNQLIEILKAEGVKEINPKVGQLFDATKMHALDVEFSEDIKPNHIVRIISRGYLLHDRMIRPARVVVATNKKEENEKKEEVNNLDA